MQGLIAINLPGERVASRQISQGCGTQGLKRALDPGQNRAAPRGRECGLRLRDCVAVVAHPPFLNLTPSGFRG